MRNTTPTPSRIVLFAVLAVLVTILPLTGCAGGGTGWQFFGTPYTYSPSGSSTQRGPSSTGQTQGGATGQSSRTPVDPCTESQARRFVTISMRNLCPDYVHYFFVAVAFVDVDQTAEGVTIPAFESTLFPDGAICPANEALYRQFGYTQIPAGEAVPFGDYCITGPAYVYFHRAGQFRRSAGAGSTGLGSAIAPAQGASPTYDNFFTSAGVQIPVPDLILFHNPGTGEGAALKSSRANVAPCDFVTNPGDPVCQRDSFYYVDDRDIMAGSTALGQGSGRRVPAEIQGTGCECTGQSRAYQVLAPSGVSARDALCNEFLRGGRIDYAFVRVDENPPFPQLVWRVTDASGTVAEEFDPRARVP